MGDYEPVDSSMRLAKEAARPDAKERHEKSLAMAHDYIKRAEAGLKNIKEHEHPYWDKK